MYFRLQAAQVVYLNNLQVDYSEIHFSQIINRILRINNKHLIFLVEVGVCFLLRICFQREERMHSKVISGISFQDRAPFKENRKKNRMMSRRMVTRHWLPRKMERILQNRLVITNSTRRRKLFLNRLWLSSKDKSKARI